jgi:hypothetical protein
MSNQVALVLDDEMPELVKSFFNRIPIWIVQTDENAECIKTLRHQPDSSTLVTTFPRREGESKADLAERIIYTLDDHHNEHARSNIYDTLLVSGLTLRELKEETFRDLGFSEFEETDFGFITRKLKREITNQPA